MRIKTITTRIVYNKGLDRGPCLNPPLLDNHIEIIGFNPFLYTILVVIGFNPFL